MFFLPYPPVQMHRRLLHWPVGLIFSTLEHIGQKQSSAYSYSHAPPVVAQASAKLVVNVQSILVNGLVSSLSE